MYFQIAGGIIQTFWKEITFLISDALMSVSEKCIALQGNLLQK